MIVKGNDYDSVSAFGQSDFKPLPSGGYICRLIMAEEMADKNGNPMLHIGFDIIEGEYKNYFMDLFQSRKKNNTDPLKEIKWPFAGQAWIPVNDYEDNSKTSRKFKGFCTAVEESGTEIWTPKGELNLNEVKSAEVGVIFQNVESEYNGKTRWEATPWGFRSIATVAGGDYFVPDDKPLKEISTYGTGFVPTSAGSADSFSAADDDIPFK